MEWYQYIVVGLTMIGAVSFATYRVLVAVVREKERIYERRQQRETERNQLELTPVSINQGVAETALPGLLANAGVRVTISGNSPIAIIMETKENRSTVSPTVKDVMQAWFEEWYAKEGRFRVLKRPGQFMEHRPGEITHKSVAYDNCPEPSQNDWDRIARELNKTKITRVFNITLLAGDRLIMSREYEDLEQAAGDIRGLLLSIDPEPILAEAEWEKAMMGESAEQEKSSLGLIIDK